MNFLAKTRRSAGLDVFLFLALSFQASHGQTPRPARAGELQSTQTAETSGIAREIDDPSSGDRWLLIRSADHPEGPGHLLPVNRDQPPDFLAIVGHNLLAGALVPMIRAGDALIVEEHTAVVDARFEAVALGPARPGEAFRVRLKLGGAMVRAVATGPGRAALAPDREPRP